MSDRIDEAIARADGTAVEGRQFGPVNIGQPGQAGVSGRPGSAVVYLPLDATEAEVAEFMAWLSLTAIQVYRQVRASRSAGRITLPDGQMRLVASRSAGRITLPDGQMRLVGKPS